MQSQSIVCIEHSGKFSHKLFLQTKLVVYGGFLFTKISLVKDNTKSMLGKSDKIQTPNFIKHVKNRPRAYEKKISTEKNLIFFCKCECL